MMNIDEKINNILTEFNKKHAKFWKIGTSILETFKRLFENIKNIPTENMAQILIEKVPNHKDKYKMIINGVNITPTRLKSKIVSESTMKQYLEMLSGFGILYCSPIIKLSDHKFDITPSFRYVISQIISNKADNWQIVSDHLLINGIETRYNHRRDIAYSLFIFILKNKSFSFDKLDKENQVICTLKSQKINISEYESVEIFDNKQAKTTYDGIVNIFINIELKIIIDYIYEKWDKQPFYEEKNINHNFDILQDKKFLNERSKFKNNIIEHRLSLGLLSKNKEKLYSDLEMCEPDNNLNNIQAKINDLEAAHIYDVWRVTDEYEKIKTKEFEDLNQEKSKIESYVSDPFNGLLMCVKYHTFFDKKYFNFNINGEMIWRKEDEEYLFNDLKLHKIKINPKILTKKMQFFLEKRVY